MIWLRKAHRSSPLWVNFVIFLFLIQVTVCVFLFVKILTGSGSEPVKYEGRRNYRDVAAARAQGRLGMKARPTYEPLRDGGDEKGKGLEFPPKDDDDGERDGKREDTAVKKILTKQKGKRVRFRPAPGHPPASKGVDDVVPKEEPQDTKAVQVLDPQISAPEGNSTGKKAGQDRDFKYLYPNEFGNSSVPGNPQRLRMRGTTFILNNPYMCQFGGSPGSEKKVNGSEPKPVLLVLIQSRRGNFLERETIRNTYLTVRQHKGWDIRHMFLIGKGKGPSSTVEEHQFQHIRLAWEFDTFGDIVTGPFRDTPHKFSPATTYQHVMGIRWALRYCKRAQYVVKANDDNFVDTLQIIENAIPKMKKMHASFLCSKRFLLLDPSESDSSDPEEEIIIKPGKSKPSIPYCSGEAYLADMEALKKIYLMLPRIPFNKADRDDAFVTGRLRQAYIEYVKKQNSGSDPNNSPTEEDGKKSSEAILPILKVEHLEDHLEDTCTYERSAFMYELGRMYFHKLTRPDFLVNDAWCFWKSTLEDKGMLKDYYERKFIFSAMAM